MKKILTLCFALMLGAVSANAAKTLPEDVIITLPDEATLIARIRGVMGDQFIEKTGLVKRLAGKEKFALGVYRTVESAMDDYSQILQGLPPIAQVGNKPLLIKSILQDHPEAIDELKSQGLL